MKPAACLLVVFLLSGFSGLAQEDPISLPDFIEGAQQWAEENLDTNLLNAVPEASDKAVQEFFRQLHQRFQGDYVVDLASLRETAKTILPLLENSEETQPYAAWLKAQMPYFEVADEMNITVPAPTITTNQASNTVSNPPPQREREIWIKKVAPDPWPPGAKKYVKELKPVFAAQKIPAQLVWLAEVESSFDRRAQSPAGAAGLFQLMPATARRFGLSTWPFDQRFQPAPSATASAQYLKFLHDKFGSWRLALAGYNAGEGTVQRLLTRHHAKSFDEIATHLPAETQMYVPRVEAVILQREGLRLEELSVPLR